jgi:Fur family peroxide stress response transcriptional regulator
VRVSQVQIRDRFKSKGLKVTPQRAAIYKALAETTSHPTADELHKQVRRAYPMISPNTVYYSLGVFRKAGLVREVNYWHDRTRFDANVSPHHHLICLGCRTITDLNDKRLDQLVVSSEIPATFQVVGHQVEIHGLCAGCRVTTRR